MKKVQIILVSILITVFAISGCGTKPASTQNNSQATIETQANEAAQKAKEKSYYDEVTSGTTDVVTALNHLNSIIGYYNPHNSLDVQELVSSIMDISKKVEKVAAIDPPTGYEHVQALYKQGADILIKSMVTFTDGLDKNDSAEVKTAINEMNQSNQDLVQAINEMKSILTSHGISY